MKRGFKRVWRIMFWEAFGLSCLAVGLLFIETRHSAAWPENKRQQFQAEVTFTGVGVAAIAVVSGFGWWWCDRRELMNAKQQGTTEQKHD